MSDDIPVLGKKETLDFLKMARSAVKAEMARIAPGDQLADRNHRKLNAVQSFPVAIPDGTDPESLMQSLLAIRFGEKPLYVRGRNSNVTVEPGGQRAEMHIDLTRGYIDIDPAKRMLIIREGRGLPMIEARLRWGQELLEKPLDLEGCADRTNRRAVGARPKPKEVSDCTR